MKLQLGTAEEAGIWPESVQRIRSRAEQWVASGGTPALVLVAARRGVVFFHEAFGQVGPEADSPALTTEALFPLASMSKPITAAALMMLVEDGLVGLNRPVQEYIPEFKGNNADKIMVHQLLTHTSGIHDEPWEQLLDDEEAKDDFPPPAKGFNPTVHALLHLLLKTSPVTAPGEEMYYANANYYLAGEIVQRVSGISLDQFTKTRIFEPIGMDDTYFVVPEGVHERVVRRSEDAPGFFYQDKEFMARPSPSGGAFGTAMDMARFGQMFLNDGNYGGAQVLSPATVNAMTTNQIPGIAANLIDHHFPEASWGLGWSVGAPFKDRVYGELLPERGYFNHGGYGGVELWVDPANEIVGAYFSVSLMVTKQDFSIQDADLFMNMVSAAVIDDANTQRHQAGKMRGPKKYGSNQVRDIVLRPGNPEEVGIDPARVNEVIRLAEGWVESGIHPSLNIVAARNGVVFLDETLGRMGSEEDAELLSADTLFPLASITKLLTAAAVMILVEEGRIALNRLVSDYVPAFTGKGRDEVLVRHLLTHTGGLREDDVLTIAVENGFISNSEMSEENIALLFANHDAYMSFVLELTPYTPPDTEMIYAFCNYDLLAEVIISASGSSFPKFIRQRILEPLGLDNSHLPVPQSVKKRVVRRADSAPNRKIFDAFLQADSPSANGGFGSARDMAVLAQMFLNGGTYDGARLLSPASVRAMTRDQTPGIFSEFGGYKQPAEWGLGWSIYNKSKSKSYGEPLLSRGAYCHGGAGGVFFWVDPEKDLTAVFFSTQQFSHQEGQPVSQSDLFISSLLASITAA